jgi:hypothetical protein
VQFQQKNQRIVDRFLAKIISITSPTPVNIKDEGSDTFATASTNVCA